MSDWRLNGQEEYLFGKTLYRLSFPRFWEIAYRDKNKFYYRIALYAQQYVAERSSVYEHLEDDRIGHFWHEHCEFCWEKALTDKDCVFYCTEDMYYWICEECFRDFCKKFNWQEKTGEELISKLLKEPTC